MEVNYQPTIFSERATTLLGELFLRLHRTHMIGIVQVGKNNIGTGIFTGLNLQSGIFNRHPHPFIVGNIKIIAGDVVYLGAQLHHMKIAIVQIVMQAAQQATAPQAQ